MNDSGDRFAQARSRLSSRHGAGRRIYENRRDSTGNEWKTTTKQAYLSLCTREQYAATRSAPRAAVAHLTPVYLEEISSTLPSSASKLSAPPVEAADLADAAFQAIETGMTEGHPCFVANNGRLGFDVADYRAYAPEAGRPVRLLWLAARRDRATFTSGAGLDYETLIAAELDEATVAVTYAAEVARWHLVCLGYGDDEYLAQQSIRTFFNVSAPARDYVKTSLSVLNMGFLRGLSTEYMKATSAIRDNEQMVDLEDPAGALQFAGTLANPIAGLSRPAAGRPRPRSR